MWYKSRYGPYVVLIETGRYEEPSPNPGYTREYHWTEVLFLCPVVLPCRK